MLLLSIPCDSFLIICTAKDCSHFINSGNGGEEISRHPENRKTTSRQILKGWVVLTLIFKKWTWLLTRADGAVCFTYNQDRIGGTVGRGAFTWLSRHQCETGNYVVQAVFGTQGKLTRPSLTNWTVPHFPPLLVSLGVYRIVNSLA